MGRKSLRQKVRLGQVTPGFYQYFLMKCYAAGTVPGNVIHNFDEVIFFAICDDVSLDDIIGQWVVMDVFSLNL